jgi:ribosome-associated protein
MKPVAERHARRASEYHGWLSQLLRSISTISKKRKELATSMLDRPAEPAEGPHRSLQLALTAARVAEENRGRDIVILDMRELTSVFDYFVLATGASVRQLHAISDEIEHTVKTTLGDRKLGREGYTEGGWVLIDFGDVVVHLFDDKSREYYALEDLWCDARRVPFTPELSVHPAE